MKKHKKKKAHNLVHTIIMTLLCLTLMIEADFIYRNYTGDYTGFLGIGSGIVVSGSMLPTINIGDRIYTVKLPVDWYSVGDIVTYRRGEDIIIHRIIDVGDEYVITKGDNNDFCDVPVKKENILGKLLFILK